RRELSREAPLVKDELDSLVLRVSTTATRSSLPFPVGSRNSPEMSRFSQWLPEDSDTRPAVLFSLMGVLLVLSSEMRALSARELSAGSRKMPFASKYSLS